MLGHVSALFDYGNFRDKINGNEKCWTNICILEITCVWCVAEWPHAHERIESWRHLTENFFFCKLFLDFVSDFFKKITRNILNKCLSATWWSHEFWKCLWIHVQVPQIAADWVPLYATLSVVDLNESRKKNAELAV